MLKSYIICSQASLSLINKEETLMCTFKNEFLFFQILIFYHSSKKIYFKHF
jgi:hypothetical protein